MAAKRIKSFITILVVLGLLGASVIVLQGQYESIADLERQIAAIRREIDEQLVITESLMSERASFGTAEFFERVARERLGLGFRNEVHIIKR